MVEPTHARTPNMRDQQRIFTRARLVEAAVKRFGEVGYHSTTIEEIVAEAGASRATFYLHFNSKLEVLTEALPELQPDVERRYETLDAARAKEGRRTKPE